MQESAQLAVYKINLSGILDYSRINENTLSEFHQLDIRVDKTWNFKKWGLNIYLDIQNLYGFKAEERPLLIPKEDVQQNQIVANPSASYDQQYYDMEDVQNSSGTILPTIGIIIDF